MLFTRREWVLLLRLISLLTCTLLISKAAVRARLVLLFPSDSQLRHALGLHKNDQIHAWPLKYCGGANEQINALILRQFQIQTRDNKLELIQTLEITFSIQRVVSVWLRGWIRCEKQRQMNSKLEWTQDVLAFVAE
jgi:hypothetical protein